MSDGVTESHKHSRTLTHDPEQETPYTKQIWAYLEGVEKQYADAQATIADLQGQLQTARHDGVRRFIHGDDKLCLVCGAKEPCELKNDPNSPCTFDPTPMELLKANDALQQRVAQLEGDVEEQKRNYQGACVTIAKMYEAATGTNGCGPKRGVVEDLADLQADHATLLQSIETIRDAVLNGRGPLAEMDVDNDVINAILAIIDDNSLPAQSAQGHEHVWGTDGAHSNEFCKVCFVNKPQPAQGGA